MIRDKIKKQAKCFYGYTRANVQDVNSLQKVQYSIFPHSVGHLICLREKVQYLVGKSIHIDKNSDQRFVIHPLLSFLLISKIYFVYFIGKVKTQSLTDNLIQQNIEDLSYQQINALTQHIKFLYQDVVKQRPNFMQQTSRVQKLKVFDMKKQEYANRYLTKMKQYYLKNIFVKPESIDLELYLQNIMNAAKCIDIMMISEQYLRVNLTIRKIADFYRISKPIQKRKGNKITFNIKVNRPSSDMAPHLQNIFDHVELRNEGLNYRSQSIEMIKQILIECRKYQTMTSKENRKSYYEFLEPENVIFDQLTLSPKLNFQPILLNALGLNLKPSSIQNRIVFNPTPKDFNYFQAKEELLWQNQLILKDPYYGNIQMYENRYLKVESQQKLEQEKIQLQNLKEKIQVSRFLQLSYYLINSKQFGRLDRIANHQQKKKWFQEAVSQVQSRCKQDMVELQTFLGFSNRRMKNKKFNFRMEEVAEYLQLQKEDSLIEAHGNDKTVRYFNLKNALLLEIIRILSCENAFTKIYNVKKHIFIYLLIAMQSIEQIAKLVRAEKQKSGQRKSLRLYLDKNLKRVNNKSPHHYLNNCYQKIEDYKSRDHTNSRVRYIVQDDIGKKTYGYIVQIHNEIKLLRGYEQRLNAIEELKQMKNNQIQEQYIRHVKIIDQKAYQCMQKTKGVFLEAFHLEMKTKHREGPHRFNQQIQIEKEFFKGLTKKFQLLVISYLTLVEENFIMYETIIFPLFEIEQYSNKKRIEIPSDLKMVERQKQSLEAIENIVDIRKLTPKKMIYLKKQQSIITYVDEQWGQQRLQNLMADDFYDRQEKVVLASKRSFIDK